MKNISHGDAVKAAEGREGSLFDSGMLRQAESEEQNQGPNSAQQSKQAYTLAEFNLDQILFLLPPFPWHKA